jgi:hypothetical protein
MLAGKYGWSYASHEPQKPPPCFSPKRGRHWGSLVKPQRRPRWGKTPTRKSAKTQELCAMYALRQNENKR